jgi:NAD(P)-dependent dehydrogenase (short-subunit alcohol dehydrogenase family)
MPEHAGQLEGRVGIVTGASRGIGATTAKALAAEGAAVALAARDESALAEVAGDIERAGGRPLVVPVDVTDEDAVKHLVEATTAAFARLDLAVNNAGGSGHPPTPLAYVTTRDFDSAFAVNLRGVFVALKYEIPAMLATGGGAIVNMASTAGVDAVAGLAGYVAAKHGLVGLTKVAALDYAEQGVRVNALAPGPILTERLQHAGEEAQRMAGLAMPMRRIGSPEEVAAAATWLLSDAASFVTGVTLAIDGGKLAGAAPFQPSPQRSSAG